MTISGKAKLAGVLGWPVAHSLSPRLHNYWLEHYGIDGAYVPLAVSPDHFAQTLRVLAQSGFEGVNVTVPHKEAALKAVDEADDAARRIGAVNTVRFDGGTMIGTNTDTLGFTRNLASHCPDFDAHAGPAVVIGGGGAARAVVAGLLDLGAPEVRIVNRTLARVEALAINLGSQTGSNIRVVNWVERNHCLEDAAIVVNTTTQGMVGQGPLALDLNHLDLKAAVCDIVYNPMETPLLAAARARGNPVAEGLGMLLHQAQPGFASWFGIEPEVTEALHAFVADGIG
jgi:shikimate dehydrogenase